MVEYGRIGWNILYNRRNPPILTRSNKRGKIFFFRGPGRDRGQTAGKHGGPGAGEGGRGIGCRGAFYVITLL